MNLYHSGGPHSAVGAGREIRIFLEPNYFAFVS